MSCAFSAIVIEHAHEQNNNVVKGDGGAVGLYQNPKALLRWMVAGPKLARVIGKVDINCLDRSTVNTDTCLTHHEHTESAQVTFAKEVRGLVRVIEDMGNPFTEDRGDLLVFETRDGADPSEVEIVPTPTIAQLFHHDMHITVSFKLCTKRPM